MLLKIRHRRNNCNTLQTSGVKPLLSWVLMANANFVLQVHSSSSFSYPPSHSLLSPVLLVILLSFCLYFFFFIDSFPPCLSKEFGGLITSSRSFTFNFEDFSHFFWMLSFAASFTYPAQPHGSSQKKSNHLGRSITSVICLCSSLRCRRKVAWLAPTT